MTKQWTWDKMGKRLVALTMAVVLCMAVVQADYENTWQNTGVGAEDVVSVALSQVGYKESAGEKTKYGKWYGLNSYWCAMFVSWCANQAGISTSVIPKTASSTASMRQFQNEDRFYDSAYYGGSYEPQCGDLIYYNWHGKKTVVDHIGIVLYAENGSIFTIEGNTTVNRLDTKEKFVVSSGSSSSSSSSSVPNDYVVVRQHALNSIYIRGYAHPNYTEESEDLSFLDDIVDLGNSAKYSGEITAVVDEGLMKLVSSHTFGPLYGMTRGDFAATIVDLFGLESSVQVDTPAFSDVSSSHADYASIMALRGEGIVTGSGKNQFQPDAYISAAAARILTAKAAAYAGIQIPDNLPFGTSKWVNRATIAHAFYQLSSASMIQPSKAQASIDVQLNGQFWALNVLRSQSTCYVSASAAEKLFSTTSAAFHCGTQDGMLSLVSTAPFTYSDPVSSQTFEDTATGKVWCRNVPVMLNGQQSLLRGFTWNGSTYFTLESISRALGAELSWNSGIAMIQTASKTPQ